jgi:RNA polymerase sigma-70 factor (ECF subfamily)
MASTGEPDPTARFTELFRAHYNQVAAFARRRVGPDGAQEVAAETMLVAWRRLDDAPAAPLPWLYRIASYEVANFRRRQEKVWRTARAAERDRYADEATAHEANLGLATAVERAFRGLSEDDQEILRLTAWEGLTAREGADVVGCSPAAYRVRLHRARRRLAAQAGIEEERRPDRQAEVVMLAAPQAARHCVKEEEAR